MMTTNLAGRTGLVFENLKIGILTTVKKDSNGVMQCYVGRRQVNLLNSYYSNIK